MVASTDYLKGNIVKSTSSETDDDGVGRLLLACIKKIMSLL